MAEKGFVIADNRTDTEPNKQVDYTVDVNNSRIEVRANDKDGNHWFLFKFTHENGLELFGGISEREGSGLKHLLSDDGRGRLKTTNS